MFTVKKPAIIVMLIVLLVFTGYLNLNLTKQASSRVSNDYQKYEEMELAKENQIKDDDLVATISEGEETEEPEVSDSETSEGIDELITSTEENIQETIGNEDSMMSKNYFVEQRLSRDKLRAGLIDRLNEIVNNDNSSQEMITEAQQEIVEIGNVSEKELSIEGLIKAKGFEEVIVFITENNAKVVVGTEELTEQDVAKILNIVVSETGLDASNVKIMKKS
ncbi:SpoIIIAH-like family protein [Schnuerera sp. xch1]|uniref:SpoIIIAH-like family protein n=1 Tax=Schnuerera sp. xch1 TaxID=2874283 RepID=UPI001CBE520B|nr:SpoIIIAH-like family protein [Schnuerera sp. xch1]MBZ2173749.1 SpoIIIAH-like family protein [Schnuerera sp. xch1]